MLSAPLRPGPLHQGVVTRLARLRGPPFSRPPTTSPSLANVGQYRSNMGGGIGKARLEGRRMGCRPSDVDGLPVFPNLSVVDYTDCLIAACPAGGIEECLIPVARDWESTFSSWAQPPGKTEQQRSENAINAIRNAVDGSPKLRARRIKVFTQGSFRNRVTVRQDSDVDVGAMLYDYFLAQYPEGKVTADFGHHDVDYSFLAIQERA